ncbi:MAG: SEC-C metal-binding domain-containing protein [Armatimonadetes bacterium]|nr:SEC-C metal-binding domain-containing protein [Armatimonadota bacterium]
MAAVLKRLFDSNERQIARYRRRVAEINALEPVFERLTDAELRAKTDEFRQRLADGKTLDELLPEAFAAVREAAKRTLGQRHFDVQLIGGMVLHEGKIAEMKTGEGKTLTATLPLYLNALEGKGVHLVTTNDFLVRWQAQWMQPIFEALGMTVGWIQHDMSPSERRAMYARDVTYVQNAELGFDYLRDNMANSVHELVLRDLHYAIVDEVDSILVDEARTPLIISGRPLRSTQFYVEIDRLVRRLRPSSGPEPEKHDGDYFFDERTHQAGLTEQGIARVEQILGIPNLSDPEYIDIVHHVNAAIKAHTLYKRDVQYVVKEGEVIIVDEFTGHLQPGRRYSDGLHEAIEAKEGVRVQRPFQTVATITYQNLFRMYRKLAGMTGTAKTEEAEFRTIYGMPVVVVPTNRPMIRKDYPDVVYRTKEQKYRGIVSEILGLYVREQPVLVGTRSVEVSEYLSSRLKPDKLQTHALIMLCYDALEQAEKNKSLRKESRDEYLGVLRRPLDEIPRPKLKQVATRLGVKPDVLDEENLWRLIDLLGVADEETKQRRVRKYRERLEAALRTGIPHNVLNAKYHEEEGRIIAEAGRPGAVTIATNMAGRGVDIVLGGKPEDPRKSVNPELYEKVKALGGLHILGTERHESRRIDNQLRGRAGRQGDPGSSRFYVSLEDELMRLFGPERFAFLMKGWPEEEPLEHRMVTNAIERAQKKVEARNFEIRKNTLKYDDVMNKQREIIYAERRRVLMGEDIRDSVINMIERTVRRVVEEFASPQIHPEDRNLPALWEALRNSVPGIEAVVSYDEIVDCHHKDLPDMLCERARELYRRKEERLGRELMGEIERTWLLRITNQRWMDHLQEMDYLREGIYLRAYGQLDPLIQYQKEAAEYFEALLHHIAADMTKAVLLTEVATAVQGVDRSSLREGTLEEMEMADGRPRVRQHVAGKKVGRNAPCPCGSGRKYKSCCMIKDVAGAREPQ